MNSWQLLLSHEQRPLNEYRLKLINNKTNKTFRSWFGPIAWQIFRKAKPHITKNQSFAVWDSALLFDKHFAQYLMIEASLHHQFCHQLYQTSDDLKSKGMAHDLHAHDLLLYIRMTPQHPCHETLSTLACEKNSQDMDHQHSISNLLQRRLIQKITVDQKTFYDKNPHPHNHLFNPVTSQLTDCDQPQTQVTDPHVILIKPQQLIPTEIDLYHAHRPC